MGITILICPPSPPTHPRESFSFRFYLVWSTTWWISNCYCHLFFQVLTISSCFPQEHHIQTNHGSVSVAIYGDHDKPALITYPDIALNRKFYNHAYPMLGHLRISQHFDLSPYCWSDMSCFQGLLFCPEAASLLLHNFCIYHISPPGHEVSAVCCYSEVYSFCVYLSMMHLVILNQHFHGCMVYWSLEKIMQLGAALILSSTPVASVDDLADQIADVLDFFG